MKYDKMIAVNKAESEQKIKKAIRAIDDMGARGLPISVTELVRWTGLLTAIILSYFISIPLLYHIH